MHDILQGSTTVDMVVVTSLITLIIGILFGVIIAKPTIISQKG